MPSRGISIKVMPAAHNGQKAGQYRHSLPFKFYRMKPMKKARKSRNAKILFVRDTPFKPKIIRLRTVYTRKKKHKQKDET